jgi:hypothetical protein
VSSEGTDRTSSTSGKRGLDELDLTGTAPRPDGLSRAAFDIAPEPLGVDRSSEGEDLVDLPLTGSPGTPPVTAVPIPIEPPERAASTGVAPLSSRIGAFGADTALVLLLTAAPLFAATAGPGRFLAPRGLWYAAVFALYLSFFATVAPLLLFGKTVGAALTGLTSRGPGESPLTLIQSARRWLGTVLAVAGLGIPLLATARNRRVPSLADRLSGRPLVFEALEEPQAEGEG